MKPLLLRLWYGVWVRVLGVAASMIGMEARDPIVVDCPEGQDHSHLFLTFHRKVHKQPSTQESNTNHGEDQGS